LSLAGAAAAPVRLPGTGAAPRAKYALAAIAGMAAAATYQAGASTEPEAAEVNQVNMAGANPPNIVNAPL
jgi:hypothetical protein